MLQSLRDKTQGWPAKIIFGILIFVFSFFGIEGYFQAHVDTAVASVNKAKITQQAYQHAMNQARMQRQKRLGNNYDASYFDKPEVKMQLLDRLIDRELLRQATDDMGLVVSDQELRQTIGSNPAFQVDGKFDPRTYRSLLLANGLTPDRYENEVRSSLQVSRIPDLVQGTGLVTQADVDRDLKLSMQTRDIHYALLPRPAITNSKVDDKAVAAYYKAHQNEFMTPEQVSVNYIELTPDDIKQVPTPDEAALKARYAKEKSKFVQPEQRLVSHILIKVPDNATPAQQKAALAKAEAIDKKARSGADFAKLAEKYSADLGSKRQGGDLGWIARGDTNKAFEDALFALKKGQISKPVLSPEGYHIIWLRDVRSGKVKSFAQVRDQLAKELQKTDRERAYSKLASKLTDKVYSNPGSLTPVAKELGLTLQHSGLFSRQGSKSGIASNPQVVKAAFSSDVLGQGNTSDPIELGHEHLVVVHVNEHKPAKPMPLATVADSIRQKILAQRTDAAARKRAESLLAQARKSGDLAKTVGAVQASVQPAKGVRRGQSGLAPALVQALFKMPHPGKDGHDFSLVDLGQGRYALVQLDAVHAGDLSGLKADERKQLAMQLAQMNAGEAMQEFIKVLRSHAKITLHKDRM